MKILTLIYHIVLLILILYIAACEMPTRDDASANKVKSEPTSQTCYVNYRISPVEVHQWVGESR